MITRLANKTVIQNFTIKESLKLKLDRKLLSMCNCLTSITTPSA